MNNITYDFPDEFKTREAAKNLYRTINDGFGGKYNAAVVANNNLQQRYGVDDGTDEVMFFMVNAKNNSHHINFTFKTEIIKTVFEAVINNVCEEQGGQKK